MVNTGVNAKHDEKSKEGYTIYHCKDCKHPILGFKSKDLKKNIRNDDLWGEECIIFNDEFVYDVKSLRRYDVSLHEGFYCCTFIMMRIITNKFGSQFDHKLCVYTDSMLKVEYDSIHTYDYEAWKKGDKLRIKNEEIKKKEISDTFKGGIDENIEKFISSKTHEEMDKVTLVEFESILKSETNKDKLTLFTLSASWCCPCRTLHKYINHFRSDKFQKDNPLFKERVRFYGVDVDSEEELNHAYGIGSVPHTLFFYNAKQIRLPYSKKGGISGCIPKDNFKKIIEQVLKIVTEN